MYRHGVYLAPSPYEAAFWSSVHTQRDVQQTFMAADAAFAEAR